MRVGDYIGGNMPTINAESWLQTPEGGYGNINTGVQDLLYRPDQDPNNPLSSIIGQWEEKLMQKMEPKRWQNLLHQAVANRDSLSSSLEDVKGDPSLVLKAFLAKKAQDEISPWLMEKFRFDPKEKGFKFGTDKMDIGLGFPGEGGFDFSIDWTF